MLDSIAQASPGGTCPRTDSLDQDIKLVKLDRQHAVAHRNDGQGDQGGLGQHHAEAAQDHRQLHHDRHHQRGEKAVFTACTTSMPGLIV